MCHTHYEEQDPERCFFMVKAFGKSVWPTCRLLATGFIFASLLGLGSKFCIETRLPPSNLKKTFASLTRSMRLQAWINEEFKGTRGDFIHG